MIPSATGFLPWRRALPPAEPPLGDLVAESEQRERDGHLAEIALRREEIRYGRAPAGWAGPEGLDPVVFGPGNSSKGAKV